jgi:hypothetical protein
MSDRHESWVRGTVGGGRGCKCAAKSEVECGCPDVDWTSQEVYDLRAENAALKAEVSRISLRWEIADHRVSLLWAERDEARRLYCEERYLAERADLRSTPTSPEVIAANRGWDCFKEEDK